MKEFTFDPAPVKFKIKSINGKCIEVTSVVDTGNIIFTISGKPDALEDVKSKHDLEITHKKFIALVDQKDLRVAAMRDYINNDEKADILINCLHVYAKPEATEEEKKEAATLLINGINAFYNAYVREHDRESKRRDGKRRFGSSNDSRGGHSSDRRSEYRLDSHSSLSKKEADEHKDKESETTAVISRKQRVARPVPQKKSMKQKPVRVRTTKPKLSE